MHTNHTVSWSGDTSVNLLNGIRANNPDAWLRLDNLYRPLILNWCRRLELRTADAEDVLQEVLRSVFSGIERYTPDGQPGSFRRWLRTITNRRAIDAVRRDQRQAHATGGSDALNLLNQIPGAGSADDEHEELALLRRATEMVLSDFGIETRRAFLALVVEGRDAADVSNELKISVNAVYLAKSRVKQRLKEEFGELVGL